MECADRIKKLVQQAGEHDYACKVFGSEKYKYKLNPTIPFADIETFEQQYSIKLPDEYVYFMTHIGNGGAGPYYGIYPLEKKATYTKFIGNDMPGDEPFINDSLTKEQWNEYMTKLEECDDDAYDEIMKIICDGMLVIATQGCTYDVLLMYKGNQKGKIVYFDWNLDIDSIPYFTGMTFMEWYETFFEEIIKGNNVSSYGYLKIASEEQLMEDFLNSVSDGERITNLCSLYRFNTLQMNTISMIENCNRKTLDQYKLDLLLHYSKENGIRLFDKMLAGENVKIAVQKAKLIEEKEKYYEVMLSLLYQQGDYSYKSIMFFLDSCKCKSAKDIIDYADNEENEEDKRRTAIWLMGHCEDKIEYLEYFIKWMREGSYWIAHSALQAVAHVKSQQLLQTYEFLREKYKGDSTIASNIEVALRTFL